MCLVIFFILMFLGLGYAQTPQKVYETKLALSDKEKQMAVDKLNKNAEEIVTFLSSANPIWEAMVKHIYTISDAIVDAIAKQFPNKMIEGG